MIAVSQDDRGDDHASAQAVIDGRTGMNFWRHTTPMLGGRLRGPVFAPCSGFRPPFNGITGHLLQHSPRPVRS
jgi:hypothetical protein